MTKTQRAIARIEQAKKIYANGPRMTEQSFVLDLLVDLHHYCEAHRLDMHASVSRAELLFNRESKP